MLAVGAKRGRPEGDGNERANLNRKYRSFVAVDTSKMIPFAQHGLHTLSPWAQVTVSALAAYAENKQAQKEMKTVTEKLCRELKKFHENETRLEEKMLEEEAQATTKIARNTAIAVSRYWSMISNTCQKQMKVDFTIVRARSERGRQEEMLKESERLTHKLVQSISNWEDPSTVEENGSGSQIEQKPIKLELLDTQNGKRPLRPYQARALRWMINLYDNKLNGILADEMGLGKTVQAIALLAYFAEYKQDWGPHLIVVPTTVVVNWELELKRWCPSFKVIRYIGSVKERKRLRQGWSADGAFNVCVTSYNTVIRDKTVFRSKTWGFLILDEAHHIKNWASQKWQTMFGFQAQYRLLLTGTPLQNSVMELWALFHFLMPNASAFESNEDFQQWYSNPMSEMVAGRAAVNEELVRRLHALLRPFLLRRLKKDVESQLPSKTEKVLICKLSRRQRALYDDYLQLADTKNRILHGGYLGVLGVLIALRKVCAHPDLFEERPLVSPMCMSSYDERIRLSAPRVALFGHILPFSGPNDCCFPSLWAGCAELLRMANPEYSSLAALESAIKAAYVGDATVEQQLSRAVLYSKKMAWDALQSARWKEKENIRRLRAVAFVATLQSHRCHTLWQPAVDFFTALLGAALLHCCQLVPTQDKLALTFPFLVKQIPDRVEEIMPVALRCCAYVPKVTATPATLICHLPVSGFGLFYHAHTRTSLAPLLAVGIPTPKDEWYTRDSFFGMADRPGHAASLITTTYPYATRGCFTATYFCSDLWPFHIRRCFLFPDRRLIIHDCGKLQLLERLIKQLRSEGHRCLIFSQFTVMLNVLEKFLALMSVPYLRIDGSTKPEARQFNTERFNRDDRITCMILSTRSGGVGVNLVGADTVIFYDSDWNPAMDLQAQDRCHRIGQTRPVTIYRLISEGTVEEKILEKARQRKMLNNVVIRGGEFRADTTDRIEQLASLSHRSLLAFFTDVDEGNIQPEEGEEGKQRTLESALAEVEDVEDRVAQACVEAELREERDEEGLLAGASGAGDDEQYSSVEELFVKKRRMEVAASVLDTNLEHAMLRSFPRFHKKRVRRMYEQLCEEFEFDNEARPPFRFLP